MECLVVKGQAVVSSTGCGEGAGRDVLVTRGGQRSWLGSACLFDAGVKADIRGLGTAGPCVRRELHRCLRSSVALNHAGGQGCS